MISSKYIVYILDLLLDGDANGKALRPQIDYLTDVEYDYTGVGVFVTFHTSKGIENFRHGEDRLILDGVTITSTELRIGASATVFINKGFIDYLELWSYDGEYPKRELGDYTIKQEGDFGTGREIRSSEINL
jgi:hypothetical protein